MHYGIIPAGGGIAQAEEKKQKAGQIEELESITVTSGRTQHTLADVPEETIVITAEELDKLNTENALEALRWVPGMQVYLLRKSMGGDTFQMNGSANDAVLVLVDGNRTKGSYVISEIPVSSIERIEIVKGGNSVLYGNDALAGVINIITKKPTEKVSGSVKTIYMHDTTSQGDYIDRETLEASVGFSTANLRHRYSAQYHRAGDVFDTKNASGKWGFDLNDEMELGLGFGYNNYKQDTTTNNKYKANLNFDWKTDISTLKLKSFYQNFDKETKSNNDIEKDDFFEQEVLYSISLLKGNLLTVGYQFTQDDLDITDEISKKRKKYSLSAHSVILQDEQKLFDMLTLVPAVRIHSYDDWKRVNVDPKVSVLLRATDTLSFRATAGTAYKIPSMMQMYQSSKHPPVGMGFDLFFVGNPDLKPQKSKSIRLSAEQRIGNFFIGNLAVFRTEYEDKIEQYTKKKVTPPMKMYRSYKNVDGGSITQGVELNTKYWLTGNILFGLGYTFFNTEDKKTGKTLENTTEHRVMPSVRYQDDEWGLVAEVRGDYERYAEQTASHYDLNGPDNFQLNANISKEFRNNIKVWLNGENLLNRKKEQGITRNKMVLSLGLEYKF